MIRTDYTVLDLSQKATNWCLRSRDGKVMRGFAAVEEKRCFGWGLTPPTVIFGRSRGDLATCVLAAARPEAFTAHRFPVPSESPYPASPPGPSRSHGCVFVDAACTSRPVSGCGSASLLEAVPEGLGCPPPSRQPPLPARWPAAGSGLPGAGGGGGGGGAAGRPLAAPAHHASPAGCEQARGGAAEAAPLAPLGESIAGGSRKGGEEGLGEIFRPPMPWST